MPDPIDLSIPWFLAMMNEYAEDFAASLLPINGIKYSYSFQQSASPIACPTGETTVLLDETIEIPAGTWDVTYLATIQINNNGTDPAKGQLQIFNFPSQRGSASGVAAGANDDLSLAALGYRAQLVSDGSGTIEVQVSYDNTGDSDNNVTWATLQVTLTKVQGF